MTEASMAASAVRLVEAIQQLAVSQDLESVYRITTSATRCLTGSDAASLLLFDDGSATCHCVAEDAEQPLFRHRTFEPSDEVISAVLLHGRSVVIGDTRAQPTARHAAASHTAASHAADDEGVDDPGPGSDSRVRALAMLPVRSRSPIGALGIFWSHPHQPDEGELLVVQALADSAAVAISHLRATAELERQILERTAELADRATRAEDRANALETAVERHRRQELASRVLSATDELTGLPNRRGFLYAAERARSAARLTGTTACLLFFDLDGLKAVNDGYGHDIGDRLLKAAAASLAEVLRQPDVVGRWGGDEFVAFLAGAEDADNVRARVIRALESLNSHDPLSPQLSVGAVLVRPDDDRSIDDLLAIADAQMYNHKRSRRH